MAESENDVLHVVGGKPLNGTIKVRGAKNFVSKAMVAALLAPGKSVLKNVPEIRDVHVVSDLLRLHGVDVEVDGTNGIVNIDATHVQLADVADVDTLSGSSRIPILFSGPLVHRLGEAFIPALGGCAIGGRPIDFHLERCASWVPRSTRSTRTAFTSPLRTACTARRSICRTRPWRDRADAAGRRARRRQDRAVGCRNRARDHGSGGRAAEDGRDHFGGCGSHVPHRGRQGAQWLHAHVADRPHRGRQLASAALATRGDIFVKGATQPEMITFLNVFRKVGGKFEVTDRGIRFWHPGGDLKPVAIETDVHPGS